MPTDDKLFVDAENFKMYIYKQIRRFSSMQFNILERRTVSHAKSIYYSPGQNSVMYTEDEIDGRQNIDGQTTQR